MKPTKMFRMITPMILAMFILSLFGGTVVAQSDERYEKAEKQYQTNKENFEKTKKQFEEAKKLFEDANKRLKDAKDGNKSEELLENARQYMLKAINHTESQLKVMKEKLDNPENRGIKAQDAIKIIDAHMAQLEQLRVKVNNATTIKEIRDAHKELAGIVANINLETRYFLGMVLNLRIDNFIIKAENVSERLDAAIKDMKAKGKETKKLEKGAADFNRALDEAKESHNKTKELYAVHKGFAADGTVTNAREAKAFLKEANELQRDTIHKLKNAGKQVIDFVKDFKKIVGRNVKVGEKGDLEVNGGTTVTLTATPVQTTAPNQIATPVQTTAPNQTATPVQTSAPNQTATPEPTATVNATSGV